MFKQIPKQLIDTGEIGNASTGDILFDGGNKLNDDINAIYNAFGDQRKMKLNNGQGKDGQTIHANGYYQKADSADYYSTPVDLGTMHDIDTTAGGVLVTLSKGKLGEAVSFINSNGSISVNNPLTIQAIDSFIGVNGNLVITSPYCEVVCRCISESSQEGSIWNYSIRSMFGQQQVPTEGTWSVNLDGSATVPLFHKSEYNSAKLLVTCQTADGKKAKNAELNILIDSLNSSVLSTEYAVMRFGNQTEDDEIANISFTVNTAGFVTINISSKLSNLRASIKVIATQKIGVPQS